MLVTDSVFGKLEHLIPLNKFSDLNKLTRIYRNIFVFIDELKLKLKDAEKYNHLNVFNNNNIFQHALLHIIKVEQKINFSDIFEFFLKSSRKICETPALINRYNLYIDSVGMLRVKSK